LGLDARGVERVTYEDAWDDIRAMWESRDKRRTHWEWAMPRDMWRLLQTVVDDDGVFVVCPSVHSAAGSLFRQPIVIDNNVDELTLRPRQ